MRMPVTDEERRTIAEEVRLIHKEMRWVLQHIARISEVLGAACDNDSEDESDHNQLSIFDA